MKHFAFTKLVVADLERSAAFYTHVFGLHEQYRVKDLIGGRPMEEILFESTAPGGATFVLLHFDDLPEPMAGSVIGGFVTDEVHELFARAVAAGATVVDPVHDAPEHGVRVGFLADPDGHLLEVCQLLVTETQDVAP
jgi:catechol 2,3-dioxygenase-like lactoylglutathione lyase family enzyme